MIRANAEARGDRVRPFLRRVLQPVALFLPSPFNNALSGAPSRYPAAADMSGPTDGNPPLMRLSANPTDPARALTAKTTIWSSRSRSGMRRPIAQVEPALADRERLEISRTRRQQPPRAGQHGGRCLGLHYKPFCGATQGACHQRRLGQRSIGPAASAKDGIPANIGLDMVGVRGANRAR